MSDKRIEEPYRAQLGASFTSYAGTATLVGWRLLAPAANYLILTRKTSILSLRALPNIPLTTSQGLLLWMPSYIALKHITWSVFLKRKPMNFKFAFFGGMTNLVFEGLTSYVYTLHDKNPTWTRQMVYVGFALNAIGIAAELVSEIQRHRFKEDPRNEGELCATGPWGYARNINYGCNVVWSFGYTLAAGGPVYALLYTGIYLNGFVAETIPQFERYMKQKYADRWETLCKNVPWRLFPGIY